MQSKRAEFILWKLWFAVIFMDLEAGWFTLFFVSADCHKSLYVLPNLSGFRILGKHINVTGNRDIVLYFRKNLPVIEMHT